MATSFSGQLLRDSIIDHSKTTESQGLQAFTLRDPQLEVLRLFDDSTKLMFTPEQLQAIKNLRNVNQDVLMNLYQKRALGAGSARVRSGSGSSAVAQVSPTFLTGIQVGLDMSTINQSIRQYMGDGGSPEAAVNAAYKNHLSRELDRVFKEIYTRLNNSLASFVDSNIWALNTTADAGTIYTTYLADAKRVPNTDTSTVLQNMQIENRQNNFEALGGGTPYLLASPASQRIMNTYLKSGVNNSENNAQFLNWFDLFVDNQMADGAGVQATMYEIMRGTVGWYQRVATAWNAHPQANGGDISAGIDTWHKPLQIGRGTTIMPDMPPLTIELKSTRTFSDTSATYTNNPESVIDLIDTWSFYIEPGAMVAYDPAAAVSPIIKYEVLS